MASGNRSGYGSWELDKGEINFDFCDVGLGLKLPFHHQQHQQEQRQNSISWLQNHSENSRSPTISGVSPFSRFVGVTFTAGQRQELERQTMIFKHMMASLPVPAELLMPFPKCSSSFPVKSPSSVGRKTGVEMRYGGNRGGGDAEPWRCRRTDGKKWRCSRDVAPDQKYCERHSHKGRPSRSRKPVESPSPFSSSLSLSSSSSSSSSSSLLSSSSSLSSPSSSLLSSSVASTTCNPIIFTPFSTPKPTTSSSSFDLTSSQFNPLPRYPEWFMKEGVAPTASPCLFSQHLGGNGTTTSTNVVDDHQSCLLPRPFIDAWSLGDHVDPKDATTTTTTTANNNNATVDNEKNKCCAPSSPLNSILPLTLSMSAGFDPDHHHNSEEHAKDSPEIRLSSSSQHHHQQPLNWMTSWISSPPGGPLAEALCLGISGAGNGIMSNRSDELVSPHGHSTSSSTTTLG